MGEHLFLTSLNKPPFFRKAFHDLRNPLVVIKGYLALMREGCGGDLSEEHREWVDDMRSNSEHLLDLVNTLADLSFLESGIWEEKKTSLDMKEIVARSLKELAPMRKNVSTAASFPEKACFYDGDELYITRACRGLIHHGLVYGQEGAAVPVKLRDDPHALSLVVEVPGLVLAEDQQKAICEGFFSGEPAGEAKATGLELLIAHMVAANYGGGLVAESAPGKGTSYTLTFVRFSH
ncbi:MAG: HAMP domain-containing sensor histidine kinase [Candidatus Eremiobacteraeota bacterium]|nr:HAMP domain-containing sensor histidine kinase [Candidatus Eremiobacteraeota bacterium]